MLHWGAFGLSPEGNNVVRHVFEVPDDAYEAIAVVAAKRGETPQSLFDAWIAAMQTLARTPHTDVDPDQAWYWTPEWQAKEREADEAIAAGLVVHYANDEEFLRSFDANDDEDRGKHADI